MQPADDEFVAAEERTETRHSHAQSSWERITTSFSICMSSIVYGMPPTPKPDSRKPAKGIQSTRKAVWSLTMTAEAFRRRAARRAVSRSRVKTAAWKA